MDLAISSLVTGDYQKAKQMFDAAIEIDSQFPSAWLGKAFSEIAFVQDEDFNQLTIDEYLSRAMRTTDNILKYKVAIAGCLAYRHAVIIKKCVLAVEEALRQKKEAEKKKTTAKKEDNVMVCKYLNYIIFIFFSCIIIFILI